MLLTRFLPPHIRRGLRAFRAALATPVPPFEGNFESFDASKPTKAEFNKEWWKDGCKDAVYTARATTAGQIPLAPPTHWLLPFLISTMPKGRKIRIFDLGGGAGLDFVYAAKLSGRGENDLEYHVLDMPAACEAGRELPDMPVTFHVEPPPATEKFDIVYACGALQYFEDYRKLLATFASYFPQYILLCRVSAHEGRQFVRAHTNIGGRTPTWLFSLSNLDAALPDYERTFCAKTDDDYPMHNYPEDSKVGWNTNALYVRRVP